MEHDASLDHATERDRELERATRRREQDWRVGPVVYQVLVDRFAPPDDLTARQALYPPPRRTRSWHELPRKGRYLPGEGVWSHELDFWGGDLAGLTERLDHLQALQADVLYLNPVHQALTNHKYDAEDYFTVSREYGTRDDLRALARQLHRRELRLVLDGVFNHMGRRSRWFQQAISDRDGPRRRWFFIGPQYPGGVRRWADVDNLPALRLEHPEVQARIFGDPDSVVQDYLRGEQDGADGWRLDVAYDMGPAILERITRAAHAARPGSLVLGEIWNYPEQWFPALDGVLNFHLREVILMLVQGRLGGAQAGRLVQRAVADAGLEPLLRSWLFLDNHDTARLKNLLPSRWQRRMAQLLQFTLPGAPGLYYGSELGLSGGRDPGNRAPMPWERAEEGCAELDWTRWLTGLRRQRRALRVGQLRLLDSEQVLAYLRVTGRVEDTVLVLANPCPAEVHEVLALRDSRVMNRGTLRQLTDDDQPAEVVVNSGLIQVTVPARTCWVMAPVVRRGEGYSQYLRVS